jgi:LuxR family transcriptional regulator, maltose regulon positive regulatory protein
MSDSLLLTKLYIPPPRQNLVMRPRLIEQLNNGLSLDRKLTLISAPAGFGKTTLVSEWVTSPERFPPEHISSNRVAWLSLDEADNDPARFVSYLITALQMIMPGIGEGLLVALQSSQQSQLEPFLTTLINEISLFPEHFVLVLDDYHTIDSQTVDKSVDFLIEHQPPQMHLVITTREDPQLPLARYRARGQLTELRAADLRFTQDEASEFLNRVTGLSLSVENIAALETRTEGWIAGLQLAAISMQGHKDAAEFIQSFTGSHRFVMDYLLEEVLHQQSENIQTFLLCTSVLDRMCGPLCDAILSDPSVSGQTALEFLERTNLFTVPLDNERHWYRYHHLFSDLLRKRMEHKFSAEEIANLHICASEWYENNGQILEAFKHAAAANDLERAGRLMEHKEMPLNLPGVPVTILNWLESLPTSYLDSRPSLWWKQAAMMLSNYQVEGVEEKLQAAEAALALKIPPGAEMDEWSRNLVGKIAVARAMLAQTMYEAETSLVQVRRAFEYLHPKNVVYRSNAAEIFGFAQYLLGDRDAAEQAYIESFSLAQEAGDRDGVVVATTRLGQVHELKNQLHQAEETYQRALQLMGEDPIPFAAVVYIGLARIYYQWNDLEMAEKYGELSCQLARLCDQVIDRLILSELFLCRLRLARGDGAGAAHFLAEAEQNIRAKDYAVRLPDIATHQVLIHLFNGNVNDAVQLAGNSDCPLTKARAFIAQGNSSAALAVLEPHRKQLEDKNWVDGLLETVALQAIALHELGKDDPARQALAQALTLAEPGGFIRLFVDKGKPMQQLIEEYRSWHMKQSGDCTYPMHEYVDKILAAFTSSKAFAETNSGNLNTQMIDPLSQRELEVLQLICQGLSNQEICKRLYLALDTVKGHNRRIFEKLQVHRRTEAIARAHELGLF